MPALTGDGSPLAGALRHDRRIALGGLVAVIALSWTYILAGAGMNANGMSGVGAMMSASAVWTADYFLMMLVMWWGMMVAMMLPSAAPMILLFASISRTNAARGHRRVPTSVFAAGYVLVWGVFSILATLLQWGLDTLTLLTPMLASTSVLLGAALLIAAGLYQLTPLKYACLRHCRSPIHFLGHRWQSGTTGAFRMGLEHGLFCFGCCWVLMGLLFFGGVMNLAWIAGLALYVLLEKLSPAGHWLSRFAGVALVLWGVLLLAEFVVSSGA